MPMHRLSQLVPWRLKIAGKIALARLPVPNQLWRKLRLFRHGDMDDFAYAYRTFRRHFDRAEFPRKKSGFRLLELGPGDSLLTAMFAWAHGGSQTWLVDVGSFASGEVELYQRCQKWLSNRGLATASLQNCHRESDVLAVHSARYLTNGLASLRQLEDNSVDFAFSQAVLEHVHRDEFVPTLKELHRVLRPGGAASHRVDLRDHLGGGLNNLRFSPRRWESDLFRNSGFYTNRIRFLEMLDLCERAGFEFEVTNLDQWDALPTSRQSLAKEFRDLAEDDLLVRGFDVLLRPKALAHARAA